MGIPTSVYQLTPENGLYCHSGQLLENYCVISERARISDAELNLTSYTHTDGLDPIRASGLDG